ncbi:hypothetical protein Kpol_1075p2, partial [Vanderwaltozyma polyspora DSM 70294]
MSTNPFEDDTSKNPVSPFDDNFQFENDLSSGPHVNFDFEGNSRDRTAVNYDTDTGNGSDMKDVKFDDGENDLSFEQGDTHSFEATPNIHRNSGTFEDITLQDDGNNRMKRLRWGTHRNKRGNPNVGRAKTLRWAKKNFQQPFEEFIGMEDSLDDAVTKNRADELRTVYFNLPLPKDMLDDDGNPITEYPRNKIRTTKYTPLTFFPKNILFQFHNFANIYFLVLIILGAFQIFGVTNPGFAAVPLIVIVCITAFKDAFEDSRRTVLDLQVNNTKTHILEGVVNENVSADNVSSWRKFKKANSRLLFRFINFCKEQLTKEGKHR